MMLFNLSIQFGNAVDFIFIVTTVFTTAHCDRKLFDWEANAFVLMSICFGIVMAFEGLYVTQAAAKCVYHKLTAEFIQIYFVN